MRHAIAGHAVNTTYTDVGSADIASLHGCNLLGQRICPWLKIAPCIFHTSHIHLGRMDGSRTTQEQLSRSCCRGANICHPCKLDSSIPAADGPAIACRIINVLISNSAEMRIVAVLNGLNLLLILLEKSLWKKHEINL